MGALETKALTLNYGDKPVIDRMNLSIPRGEITVFVGSNGCGKSTLLRSMARLMKPQSGEILLDGHAIASLPTKKVAQKLAILPQGPVSPEGLTVEQLVKQGRYPHQSLLRQWSDQDEAMVAKALADTNLTDFADRPVDSLSGGQRQRAWIAMTLAQDTSTLLLDEPTTYLDMTHQIEILDLLYELNEKQKRTIVMVLHDLNMACRYAHNIVAIQQHKVYAQGRPEEILTEQLVSDVFHLRCQIATDPVSGTPMCIPYGKSRNLVKVNA